MTAAAALPADAVFPGSEADHDRWYRALASRDTRFDGWLFAAISSTGIYCRPSCPAPVRPLRKNVSFYPTAAAAQRAGYRACKRCRPDAVPGSPEWDMRADIVGRAMRLIGDGAVDREGVKGVAGRLGVSERHLHRLLVSEVGAGPLDLARARRAHAARLLIETTALSMSDVAFAAGFSSVRQFNDTVRAVFAACPRDLRRRSAARSRPAAGTAPSTSPAGGLTTVAVRLALRPPIDAAHLMSHLAARAVNGVEHVEGRCYRRSMRLPGGPAIVSLELEDDHVRATMRLTTIADVATAVARCRRLLDLDADPASVAEVLDDDLALAPLVRLRPGMRSPAGADPTESAVRAVLGQQVSVAAARGVAGRLTARLGEPLAQPWGGVTHLFPAPTALGSADPGSLGLPARRARAVHALASAIAEGHIDVDPGADRTRTVDRLLALDGIGPWTAAIVAMRALGDPDAFPATDIGVRRGAVAAGLSDDPAALARRARQWQPWRSYAAHHLWAAATGGGAAGSPGAAGAPGTPARGRRRRSPTKEEPHARTP